MFDRSRTSPGLTIWRSRVYISGRRSLILKLIVVFIYPSAHNNFTLEVTGKSILFFFIIVHYKPEGLGSDSLCCHWIFRLT
jgi:hypothetical protein